MTKIEDRCCHCDGPYHCIGKSCHNTNLTVYYCDQCGSEIDEEEGVYTVDGEDLCLACLKERYRRDIYDN